MINQELSRNNFEALWGKDNEHFDADARSDGRLARDARLVVMTSGDSFELQSILTELKGLLDEVLRIMFCPSDEQLPLALNADGPAIIDNLVVAINDAAINVLQALDLSETDHQLGSHSARGESLQDTTGVGLPGALPISEERLRACIGGPELPAFETLVSLMSSEPMRVEAPPDSGPDTMSGGQSQTTNSHLSHFDRHGLGWASLTSIERRVAELVSLGLTNHQVGQQMFLSRHVVEDHVQHVFNKLGVTSRVELGRYALIWSMLP